MEIIQNILRLIINFFMKFIVNERQDRQKQDKQKDDTSEKEIQKKIEEANAQRLYDALKYAVNLPFYQKGYEKWANGEDKTFCNVLARKFLLGNFDYGLYDNRKDEKYHWLNYDILQVFFKMSLGQALYGTGCGQAYDLAMQAIKEKRVIKLSDSQAQAEANKGIPIWAVCKKEGWGHEAIVCPSDQSYDDSIGPNMSQAGGVNFHSKPISYKYCWGKNWRLHGIIFIKFPEAEQAIIS